MKVRLIIPIVGLLLSSIWVIASTQSRGLGQDANVAGTAPDEWFSTVQKQISQGEYRPSIQSSYCKGERFAEPRLHFANRAQNLRAYFDKSGIELMPRVMHDGQSWNMKLQFRFMHSNVEPEIIGNRIVYQNGSVIQEYANSPEGIKLDVIVLNESRKRDNLSFAAKIEIQSLQYSYNTEDCLVLSSEDGRVILSVISVFDARNRKLRHSIDYDGFGNLSLSISENNAVSPIHMSILISSKNKQIDTRMYSDNSVLRSRQTPPAQWTAEQNQAHACFGWSVSTAGDVNGDGYADVIVGARLFDNGQVDEGRTLVYHGSASGLSPTADWTAESDQAGAEFGTSVSTAGDVNGDGYADVIVGAPYFENGQHNEGRAFVYYGSASGLSPTAVWFVESDQANASLGWAVSTAGDVNNDGFSDVVVGARMFDNGQTDEGRAFVYHGSASGLASSAAWIAESDQEDACFGGSVSTAGDVNGDGYADVIVGAAYYDNGQYNEGRTFVYHGSASGLSPTADWTAESDQISAEFGTSVSTAGDVNGDGYADVIVGARMFDSGQVDEGCAFVYHGSTSGLSPNATWIAESDQAEAYFGGSVSTAGDVNGDGYADVIVGAWWYDNGEIDEGRVFVYHGSASGVTPSAVWIAESDQAEAYFGGSVSTAGDVDGNGYADVIVGAPYYDNDQYNEGRAFGYYAIHNISADSMIEPSERRYEEYSQITPSAVFRNAGFIDENNIPVTCLINLGASTVYTSDRTIDFLAAGTETLIVFDGFTLSVCGTHYQALAYSSLPEDSFFIDDTVTRYFAAARIYELAAPGCGAWKYPNADSGLVPYPTDPNWILAAAPELQQISALDSAWWVTAGAIDTAHQDLQLYGFQFEVTDTLIEEITVDWWGHYGDSIQQHCALYLWDNQDSVWSQRAEDFFAYEDAYLTYDVSADSIGSFVSSSGYMYVCAGADFEYKYSCPLLFTFNGEKQVFIGDVVTGCDIGMWLDRVLGSNIYLPPDYDEYVRIDGRNLQNTDGKYRLTVNEMLQEVTYLDEVKLYVIDHPIEYDVYPHEALIYPGYQGLKIHASDQTSLRAAIDENGVDILSTLEAEDRIYVPFERSGITGFAEPFTINLDVGELADPGSAVLYLYGSTRFQDSDEIAPVSDIYRANKVGMRLQNPRVEVIDASGRWKKVASCGMPRGHKKTVTYRLYDENGNSIFTTGDHRLRITFYTEVYLDKAWVSCHTASDYHLVELQPDIADLHYYGYADYTSPDGKYPGDYDYNKRVSRDYANVVGYYTRYGDVKPLLNTADSRFVIMCHGDEINFEFDAEDLPELAEGWMRDFVFASKGFYKMARSGRAYAYSVDPIPFYGMREDMSANGVGYYPYDPSPGFVASLLGRIYAKFAFDYPFSLSDAISMIKTHLFGGIRNQYPAELTGYCQEWNTRHVGAYYPDHYADLPPHLNLERVPLYEHDGDWTTHLASLGIPFGGHSLHSNYVRVWLVTTVPLSVEEQEFDVPSHFTFAVGNPNPFRKSTRISYVLPSRMQVCLNVYDLSGRLVRTLVNEIQPPGLYNTEWHGSDNLRRKCPSGVYFVQLTTGTEYSATRKLLLVR